MLSLILSPQPIPQPKERVCVQIEEYWLSQGDLEPALDPSYILTPSVKLNLKDLARVVSAGYETKSLYMCSVKMYYICSISLFIYGGK